MKKIFLMCFLSVFIFSSCEKGFDDFNTSVKDPSEVPSGALFGNATVALFDYMVSTNVNRNPLRLWAQQWAQTTYADESNYVLVERNINGRTYDEMYAAVIRDLRESKAFVEADLFFI